MENTKSFTAGEAMAITRLFVRLEQQIETAWHQNRGKDAQAIARTMGALMVRIYELDDNGRWTPDVNCLFDEPEPEAPAVEEPEYRGPDMDAAYDRMVEEEMGCD
jgi:hypothetical protein